MASSSQLIVTPAPGGPRPPWTPAHIVTHTCNICMNLTSNFFFKPRALLSCLGWSSCFSLPSSWGYRPLPMRPGWRKHFLSPRDNASIHTTNMTNLFKLVHLFWPFLKQNKRKSSFQGGESAMSRLSENNQLLKAIHQPEKGMRNSNINKQKIPTKLVQY